MRRVPDPDIPRVLTEVGGRHEAPVALVDGVIDVEGEVGVGEAQLRHVLRVVWRGDGLRGELAAHLTAGRLGCGHNHPRDAGSTVWVASNHHHGNTLGR
jgi:hypothetical protein